MKTLFLLGSILLTSLFAVGQTTVDHSISQGLEHPFEVKILELYSSDSLEYLDDFPYLEKLTISNWDDSIAPPEIGNLTNLKELRFINDHFEAFPSSYKRLKKLQKLEFINDSISDLSPILRLSQDLPALQELRLEGFPSSLFTEQLTFPSQISRLSLRNNHLEKLPNSVFRLTNLEVLDLGRNDFIRLEGLETFNNINTLYLDHQKHPEFVLDQVKELKLETINSEILPDRDLWLEQQLSPLTPPAQSPFTDPNSAFFNYRPNLQFHLLPSQLTNGSMDSGKLRILLNQND